MAYTQIIPQIIFLYRCLSLVCANCTLTQHPLEHKPSEDLHMICKFSNKSSHALNKFPLLISLPTSLLCWLAGSQYARCGCHYHGGYCCVRHCRITAGGVGLETVSRPQRLTI